MKKISALIDEIKADPKKIIAALAAVALFVVLDLMFVVKWQWDSAQKDKVQSQKLSKELADIRKGLSFMQKSEAALDFAKSRWLYSEAELPLILQSISSLARENGVEVLSITPVKKRAAAVVKRQPQRGKKQAPSPKKEEPVQNFLTVEVKLSLLSSYHGLGEFLNTLENSSRPIFASEILISPDPSNSLRHNINLTLKTYVKS